MTDANWYLIENRRRKVALLVRFVDEKVGDGGKRNPDAVRAFLAGLDEAQWKALAKEARAAGFDVKAPTFRNGESETRDDILKVYDDRAAKLRARNPRPVLRAVIGGKP